MEPCVSFRAPAWRFGGPVASQSPCVGCSGAVAAERRVVATLGGSGGAGLFANTRTSGKRSASLTTGFVRPVDSLTVCEKRWEPRNVPVRHVDGKSETPRRAHSAEGVDFNGQKSSAKAAELNSRTCFQVSQSSSERPPLLAAFRAHLWGRPASSPMNAAHSR